AIALMTPNLGRECGPATGRAERRTTPPTRSPRTSGRDRGGVRQKPPGQRGGVRAVAPRRWPPERIRFLLYYGRNINSDALHGRPQGAHARQDRRGGEPSVQA